MNYWIIVESYHNRLQDAKHNFEFLGVDLQKFGKKKFEKGDFLVTYITKLMKISDVREVIDIDLKNLPKTFEYSLSINKCIQTKLIKSLDEKNWISVKLIFNTLESFKGKKINLMLLNAPIKILKTEYEKIWAHFCYQGT